MAFDFLLLIAIGELSQLERKRGLCVWVNTESKGTKREGERLVPEKKTKKS